MRIYELIQCELDENNHNYNDKRVGFFMTAANVYDYLTHDGRSHDEISILNHTDKSREYIESAMESPNAIIKVHTESFVITLLGTTLPSYDTYYYCQVHEVRTGGFFFKQMIKQIGKPVRTSRLFWRP